LEEATRRGEMAALEDVEVPRAAAAGDGKYLTIGREKN